MRDGLELSGQVVAVVGGGVGIGGDVALGLAALGAAVVVIGSSGQEEAVASAITAGGGRAVAAVSALESTADAVRALDQAATLGTLDGVVHAEADVVALEPLDLAATDLGAWDRRCEAVLRRTLWSLQAAHGALAGRGGAIVVVTPSASLVGMAGLAPILAAAEGQRALVKSAARQWGAEGVRVNAVALPLSSLAPATGLASTGLAGLALGRDPDGRDDVAPVIGGLLSGASHFLTGATLTVDGGVVMAP